MKKRKGMDDFTDSENLVPEEDAEYEQKIADEQRRQAEEEHRREIEREEAILQREKQRRQARDRRIAQDKIELMKLKSGVIEQSEQIKEEHSEERVLSRREKIANFWYHEKMWILFGVFIVVVASFLIIDVVTRDKPDITVMLIADNGLTMHTDELEQFFEQYTPDLNGDGEVHVSIMSIPQNDYSTDTAYVTNSQKFFANLQQGRIIMVITDSNTDPDYQSLMADDLAEQLPDNPYIDEKGLSLNFGFLAQELNFENMPNDIHLCLRRPTATLDDSLDVMQENYDENLEIFINIANSLAERAESENDKGLKTEPTDLAAMYGAAAESEGSSEDCIQN